MPKLKRVRGRLVGWWLVSLSSCRQLAYQACALRLLCSFDQGLFDLVNKILNEAGAAKAHDVYINLYPASTGRLRPHQDRKQVKFAWLPWSSCLPAVCGLLQSATFKVNIRFSNVASELLIWVSQAVSRDPCACVCVRVCMYVYVRVCICMVTWSCGYSWSGPSGETLVGFAIWPWCKWFHH